MKALILLVGLLLSCKQVVRLENSTVARNEIKAEAKDTAAGPSWADENLDPNMLYLRHENVESLLLVSEDISVEGKLPAEEKITGDKKCLIPAARFPLPLKTQLKEITSIPEEDFHLHHYLVELAEPPTQVNDKGYANTGKICPFSKGWVRFFKIKHAIFEKKVEEEKPVSDAELKNAGGENGDINAARAAQNLVKYYSSPEGYKNISRKVREFYPAGTSNGCVAYASTALRYAGIKVPRAADERGENISTVTRPFRNFIATKLKWNRVAMTELIAGDVLFSTDEPGWPDYPAHTYIFVKWANKDCAIATILDNQEPGPHPRNLKSYSESFNEKCSSSKFLSTMNGRPLRSPFQYGYRPR